METTYSDDSSKEELCDNQVANMCFMAKDDKSQKVSPYLIIDNEFNSLEELQNAFDEFFGDQQFKYKECQLKKIISSLLFEETKKRITKNN